MKMKSIDDRYIELKDRSPNLSALEYNEMRDCEIALGMTTARDEARVEAIRRCERYAACRAAK